jgi:putative holliday junction resolvase
VADSNQNSPVTRVLALDLGKRRIGLALSDELGITAQGLETLPRASMRADLAELAGIISRKGVSLILMGKPLHMSGHEGRQVEYTRDFAERLGQATGVPVEFRDERLTTVQAERVLREGGVHLREERVRSVDMLSAVLLLQDYLDSRRI